MSDNLIACPTARTGYPSREQAEAQLQMVLSSLQHVRQRQKAERTLQIQACDRCEGFHIVQPKRERTQSTIH
jgi:hypothetical protein